jgi:putative sugar ABC transporter, permease protein
MGLPFVFVVTLGLSPVLKFGFWGRLKKFQTTFVDYQAAYDIQRLLKFTLYAGF